MIVPPEKEVTRLREAWSHGNQDALNQLMPLVYEELRQMAKNYMIIKNHPTFDRNLPKIYPI